MTVCSAPSLTLSVILMAVLLLVLLEIGVAIIQRYVFTRLNSLYVREVNNPTLYLKRLVVRKRNNF